MGYELLAHICGILTAGGLPAGEEYPGGERAEIHTPVAAVGLRELDGAAGVARFTVRVLSPRILGGWCCQAKAALAGDALIRAGMELQTEEMEYLSGCDCFCVNVTASMALRVGDGGWIPAPAQRILCAQEVQEGVLSFRAVRDQGRRLVGGHWQSERIGVTPGRDGWEIELVQQVSREPSDVGEPFVLTLTQSGLEQKYTGCCWNETVWEHTRSGLRLIRRGFALAREVTELG
jgi:hypothetical protein